LKFFRTSLILGALSVPNTVLATVTSVVEAYQRLNTVLKEVHINYQNKNFHKIDEVRIEFIESFNGYQAALNHNPSPNFHKSVKNNFALAQNYHSSLTEYWEPIKQKYGYVGKPKAPLAPETLPEKETPKNEHESHVISNIAATKKDEELLYTPMPPEMITHWPKSEKQPLLENEAEYESGKFYGESDIEYTFDSTDEELLEKDTEEPFDEAEAEKVLSLHFHQKYLKIRPPSMSSTPPESNSSSKIAQVAESTTLEATSLRAQDIYLKEKIVIEDGLKKIQTEKNNRARFEMGQLNNNYPRNTPQSLTQSAPVKKKNTVFANDRLAEDDEDVIIITFPRKE